MHKHCLLGKRGGSGGWGFSDYITGSVGVCRVNLACRGLIDLASGKEKGVLSKMRRTSIENVLITAASQ